MYRAANKTPKANPQTDIHNGKQSQSRQRRVTLVVDNGNQHPELWPSSGESLFRSGISCLYLSHTFMATTSFTYAETLLGLMCLTTTPHPEGWWSPSAPDRGTPQAPSHHPWCALHGGRTLGGCSSHSHSPCSAVSLDPGRSERTHTCTYNTWLVGEQPRHQRLTSRDFIYLTQTVSALSFMAKSMVCSILVYIQ